VSIYPSFHWVVALKCFSWFWLSSYWDGFWLSVAPEKEGVRWPTVSSHRDVHLQVRTLHLSCNWLRRQSFFCEHWFIHVYLYFIILIDMDGIVDGLNSMTCKGNTYFRDEMWVSWCFGKAMYYNRGESYLRIILVDEQVHSKLIFLDNV
jgi:hypothetical protein